MAKTKHGSVHNKHVYTRLSFLYQAAAHLAQANPSSTGSTPSTDAADAQNDNIPESSEPIPRSLDGMSRRLATDFRAVGLKTQIRTSPAIKRTICKFCDTFLVEGHTCISSIENKSKHGRKPWADTLVIKCNVCGSEKRCPVDTVRQRRKTLRPILPSQDQKEGSAPAAAEQKPYGDETLR